MKIFVVACIVWSLAACVGAQDLATARLEQAQKVWATRLEKAGGKPIPQPHYPTEEALMFLSAYDFMREGRYLDQCIRQLEMAHNQTQLGMVKTPEKATRDYQARQIYNFYVAYRILGEGKYLKWSDEAATAMLKI